MGNLINTIRLFLLDFKQSINWYYGIIYIIFIHAIAWDSDVTFLMTNGFLLFVFVFVYLHSKLQRKYIKNKT
jgi:hypothetical protein